MLVNIKRVGRSDTLLLDWVDGKVAFKWLSYYRTKYPQFKFYVVTKP
jgi:hypothetical protein